MPGMNPLRILYVDTDLVWRGGQEQLFTLMTGIKERGHLVSLAAPPNAPLSSRAASRELRTYPFEQRNELSPKAFFRLCRILRTERFDILHLNTPRPIIAGGLAARLCRVPVRVCSRRVNFPLKSYLSRFKYNWMQEAVVTVSLSIQKTLIESGVNKDLVRVIYEGVDVHWIDRLQPSTLAGSNHRLVVGTVAHLSPEKGHDTLLRATAQVVRTFPEVRLILVGEGERMSELQESVHELGVERHVTFMGFRDDSEAVLKNFDVFCLPSLSEGLSSAILVAMGSGLPVIATRVGGIPELVVEGETGILVSPGSSQELADAICCLLESAELRSRMGKAGRRRVEESFTLSRKLEETERLYVELLTHGSIG